MTSMETCFAAARGLIPVITVNDVDAAVRLGQTLADAGCGVLEVTLRTPVALDRIHQMRAALPDLLIGAGTVMTAADARAAEGHDAQFLVSPGFSATVHEHVSQTATPWLPGVATVSEAMAAAEKGYRHLKLFPANVVGGTAMLKAIGTVLPDLVFCPTGGISGDNAPEFLQLANVGAVGGSWVVPTPLVECGDWPAISTEATRTLARLAPLLPE